MKSTSQLYNDYKTALQKIADIRYASAVLQWDQETYLPLKGAKSRGKQIATLAEIAHEQFTRQSFGNILESLMAKDDLMGREKRNVQLSLDDYNKQKKLPAEFVRQMSEAVNKSFHAWIDARKQNSFSIFQDPLHDIVELKKKEADFLGYESHPYNALMNEYDKGLTIDITDKIFEDLKPQLIVLLNNIKSKPQVENGFLQQYFNKDEQWNFGLDLLKTIHFDMAAGRQDISEHPFTINFNSKDVRITTRIDENDFGVMTWSCLHEGGHALYEQGLPENEYGLPLGEYCSLSIHESQSRLWENNIGREKSFWQYYYPKARQTFGKQFASISLDDFYKGINKVEPSLVRTEADEITYHLHVMIRYEIEKMLIEGTIRAKDIPAYWNEHYEEYLGIKVPDDLQGCLQDVHWSHGSFGYFATYSLGSLYAAQIYAAILKEIPSLETDISSGNTIPVLDWLHKNIHQHGRFYTSEELMKQATGETLNPKYFIDYVTNKYSTIYTT